MRVTPIEKWLVKRWTKAGLLYQPMGGGVDQPGGPIQTGALFIYETPPLTLPQTTTKNIFTLSTSRAKGGPSGCQFWGLWGMVCAPIGAVANATKIQFMATDDKGVALTTLDACTTVDVNGLTSGTILALAGGSSSAFGTNANAYISGGGGFPRLFVFGTTANFILNCAGSDGGGGTIKWFFIASVSYGTRVAPAAS